jgi:hypothetical protein
MPDGGLMMNRFFAELVFLADSSKAAISLESVMTKISGF